MEPVDVPQAQPIKKDYIDSAFETIAISDTDDMDAGSLLDVVPFKTKRVKQDVPYICYIYTKTIKKQIEFVQHMEQQHPSHPYQCKKCNGFYQSKNGYFKHLRSHSYLKYLCSFCGFRSQFPYQYNSHIKTHIGFELYGCGKCSKVFASKSSQKSHKKNTRCSDQVSRLS